MTGVCSVRSRAALMLVGGSQVSMVMHGQAGGGNLAICDDDGPLVLYPSRQNLAPA